eukprot:CAMPEP_0206262298 /NCGR_PEP_ID=MMETSP0047_2-20121206/28157_1 /ASSEMBLY_ACC=CAM_ASM_000192 /TAXON_ID=195065 /ORGANISM="Chroomonas mesostigmatica_cf, Strain CCMP1168" /LENGTH=98 /DNA_ID=CAMNT_0053689657 /DNA_START=8 /DNA_END=301 /DNA_ORIENTATION=-
MKAISSLTPCTLDASFPALSCFASSRAWYSCSALRSLSSKTSSQPLASLGSAAAAPASADQPHEDAPAAGPPSPPSFALPALASTHDASAPPGDPFGV